VRDQITRMSGQAAPGHIVWGGDGHLSQVRAETDCDHVALDHLPDADGHVEPARDQIDDFVVHGHVERHLGIFRMEDGQDRLDVEFGRRMECVNPHGPGRPLLIEADLTDRRAELGDGGRSPLQ
jgi:hypothetical protein